MATPRPVKCKFTHCSHPDDKLPPDQMVKDGGSYYHKECLDIKNDLAKVRALYKSLDPYVVMSFLNKMINEAVFEKNISTADLIFALEYYKKTGKELKSPAQLLYIPHNREIRNAKRKKTDQVKFEFDGKCEQLGKEPTRFTYKPSEEKKGFMKVFKKG